MDTGRDEVGDRSETAWAYVVARCQAERMLHGELVAVASAGHLEVSQGGMRDAFLPDLRACIYALPPQQRAVLLADFAAGGRACTGALAAQLQTSCNSIYVSRANGRKALNAALLERGHVGRHRATRTCDLVSQPSNAAAHLRAGLTPALVRNQPEGETTP